MNVVSSVPSEFNLIKYGIELLSNVVNSPPTNILPSDCTITELTVLSKFVPKLVINSVSPVPSGFNLVRYDFPPINILPSDCTCMSRILAPNDVSNDKQRGVFSIPSAVDIPYVYPVTLKPPPVLYE